MPGFVVQGHKCKEENNAFTSKWNEMFHKKLHSHTNKIVLIILLQIYFLFLSNIVHKSV